MRVAEWNALDWVLLAVLLFSVAAGFRRGLVRTVLGLAGYVGGFMLASWKYGEVGDWLVGAGWIKSPATARVVAYLLIVVLVVMAAELVARMVHRTLRAVGLSLINRLLGAGFGLVRGAVAGMALLMIPATFAPGSRLVTTSVLSSYFLAGAHDVSFLVPEYLQRLILRSDWMHKKTCCSG
ncbi:MAG TPA: CvpA family protein [Acidobacteriaceae bacterium]|nr:CvpA family protein [Acidobacteriaceae bacterium]